MQRISQPPLAAWAERAEPTALACTTARTLTWSRREGAADFASAASGVALVGRTLWVVADDEHWLGSFDPQSQARGAAHRLLPGELPTDPKARKAAKPDFEAVVAIPAGLLTASPVLLAVGSGSTPTRHRSVLVTLTSDGSRASGTLVVSWQPLYAELARRFPELNIEGAAVVGDQLVLAQRGNGSRGENALVVLSLVRVLHALRRGGPVPAAVLDHVVPVRLPALAGVGASLTDLCALPDGRLVFSAAAEDTKNTVEDGAVMGSLVGVMGLDGAVQEMRSVVRCKVEGVHASLRPDGAIDVMLVTDADDRAKPAQLLTATLIG